MKIQNLFIFIIQVSVLCSCGSGQNTKENRDNPKVLKPINQEVKGYFSKNIQLVDKKYNYYLKNVNPKVKSKTFKIKIEFITNKKYPFKDSIKNNGVAGKFNLYFKFLNKSKNVIEPLTEKAEGLTLTKYHVINGVDLKTVLTAKKDSKTTQTFEIDFFKKKDVNQLKKAKFFKIEITENSPFNRLKQASSRLRRGGQVSEINLRNGLASISYKEQNDDSYWNSGKAIQKLMVGGPARILKKLDFVDRVKLKLPFQGKTYFTDIRKEQIEKYTGISISDLRKNWNNKFADVYISSIENAKRKAYFNRFVEVSN